jgi:hypothetical protein
LIAINFQKRAESAILWLYGFRRRENSLRGKVYDLSRHAVVRAIISNSVLMILTYAGLTIICEILCACYPQIAHVIRMYGIVVRTYIFTRLITLTEMVLQPHLILMLASTVPPAIVAVKLLSWGWRCRLRESRSSMYGIEYEVALHVIGAFVFGTASIVRLCMATGGFAETEVILCLVFSGATIYELLVLYTVPTIWACREHRNGGAKRIKRPETLHQFRMLLPLPAVQEALRPHMMREFCYGV